MSLLASSNQQHPWWATVYGPPGLSKTFSSVTLSEFCPADFSNILPKDAPKRAPVVLKDMVWLAFDQGATAGFAQQGLSVPSIDLSACAPNEVDAKINEAQKEIAAEAAAGRCKVVVVDTVTAVDDLFDYNNRVIKGLEKFDLFGAIATSHKKLMMPFKAMPVHVIWLCHAKALVDLIAGNSEVGQLTVQNNKRARAAAGTSPILPAITGKALNAYRADSTFILNVSKTRTNDGNTAFWFSPGRGEFEGKTRLVLPDTMPADWRQVRKRAGI